MREVPRYAAIFGLGFGDCGKGLFTDALCRRWQARTVVRFNGGAQAGHNVVLPDGRHHTFSQFAAGSFVPGVYTVLAEPVLVHPGALLVEAGYLHQAGVHDALSRLLIDARCRVTTPYHQAAGRLRELLRGASQHGSCGVGVGETVRDAIAWPAATLCYGDLLHAPVLREKLEQIRLRLLSDILAGGARLDAAPAAAELAVLQDAGIASIWMEQICSLMKVVSPASSAQIADRLLQSGTVLFEGAQGALLDEWYGFHPHTTWSTTLASAADNVAAGYGITERILRLGVARTYLTRHGAGPLPTQDPGLDFLGEPHNTPDGWQGAFRRGHPDGVLLRYARQINETLDGLLLSHADIFDQGASLRWCESYCLPDGNVLREIPRQAGADLEQQSLLTRRLLQVQPQYTGKMIQSVMDSRDCMEAALECPTWFTSSGNTHEAVQAG